MSATNAGASGSAAASSAATPAPEPKVDRVNEQLEKAKAFKTKGNEHYAKQEIPEALKQWHMCLLHAAGINSFAAQFGAASSEAQNAAAKELVISVQNNLSAAYLKQERWDSVITSATKVLSLSPEGDPNIKALYRRASANYAKGDVVKAAQDLDVALAKAPTDPGVRALAKKLAATADASRQEAEAKMKGFLGKADGKKDPKKETSAKPKAEEKKAAAATPAKK